MKTSLANAIVIKLTTFILSAFFGSKAIYLQIIHYIGVLFETSTNENDRFLDRPCYIYLPRTCFSLEDIILTAGGL